VALAPTVLGNIDTSTATIRNEEHVIRYHHLVASAVLATLALTATLPSASAAAAKKHRNVHFTEAIVGAAISADQSAFSLHDSIHGNGAGTQTITISGSGGSDREITYYGNATSTSKGTFTLGTPDANGIATLTGSGHDTSGTGKLKHIKSTYTYTGTYNTKTGVYNLALKGAESF